MTTEKQDLRVKINNETHALLDAYCEQSGTTKGQVITDLTWVSIPPTSKPVSYTHLTLPTILRV